jgi:hypothetical protein
MTELPHVTLICVDCKNVERAIVSVERSKLGCHFAEIKLLTSASLAADFPGYPHVITIPSIDCINDYSAFCLKRLHEFVTTSHMLLVQHDGSILNAAAWDHAWDNYDYMGPLFEQERTLNPGCVGSGGFSYRSRRLMATVAQLLPPWDGRCSFDGADGRNNWGHEDGVIAHFLRHQLVTRGMIFAPPQAAARFAFGRSRLIPCLTSFGFHGYCPETAARGVDSEHVIASAERIRWRYAKKSGPLSAEEVTEILA